MLLVLERAAAEMAAKNASSAEINLLGNINSQIENVGSDMNRAAALNQDFHRSIYRTTRNRFLLEAARALNNALMLHGPTTLDDEARIQTVHAQHSEIIDAIRSGDQAAAAGKAANEHLQTSLRDRLKGLQK